MSDLNNLCKHFRVGIDAVTPGAHRDTLSGLYALARHGQLSLGTPAPPALLAKKLAVTLFAAASHNLPACLILKGNGVLPSSSSNTESRISPDHETPSNQYATPDLIKNGNFKKVGLGNYPHYRPIRAATISKQRNRISSRSTLKWALRWTSAVRAMTFSTVSRPPSERGMM